MPNPVELYEGAVRSARDAVAGTKESQLQDPTPCADWNVQALVDRMVGGSKFFNALLTGAQPAQQEPGSGNRAEFEAVTETMLQATRDPANIQRQITLGANNMAGGEFLPIAFLDTLIHTWDLAKATGQNTDLDPKLVEACYAMFAPRMDGLRQSGGEFGPAVPVPDSASTQVRLLGVTGRRA